MNTSDVDLTKFSAIGLDLLKLSQLSLAELDYLMDVIAIRMVELQNEEKEETLKQIRDVATRIGLSVEFSPLEKKRAKPNPKYANPDTGEVWAGRGKKPLWLQSFLETEKTLEEFDCKSVLCALLDEEMCLENLISNNVAAGVMEKDYEEIEKDGISYNPVKRLSKVRRIISKLHKNGVLISN